MLADWIHRRTHETRRAAFQRPRRPRDKRRCRRCGVEFQPNSGNHWDCTECAESKRRAASAARARRWRAAKLTEMGDDERAAYRRAEALRQKRYREAQREG